MVQKIVKALWALFKKESDAYYKFRMQNIMAHRIQRYVRRHQERLSSADKTIMPPVKNEIMYLSDWGYAIGRHAIHHRLSLTTVAIAPQAM